MPTQPDSLFLPKDWKAFCKGTNIDEYLNQLTFLYNNAKKEVSVYPKHENIFAAFQATAPNEVRVVIIGQDPYHGPNQANGLAFSVQDGIKTPPSLRNIFKELREDIGCPEPNSGNLIKWAKQGVLLLNTTLTVEKEKAGSHSSWPWKDLTRSIIQQISNQHRHIVFILWGNHAQQFIPFLDQRHTIIKSAHPSPLSVRHGFFGSRPFSQANKALSAHEQGEINWCLSSELSLF